MRRLQPEPVTGISVVCERSTVEIQDEIAIVRASRKALSTVGPIDTLPGKHFVPPEVHLLKDFREWAITHHVPTDGRFGWTLGSKHEDPAGDFEKGKTHWIAVAKRGTIEGVDGYFSFEEVRDAVIHYVARYDHPWTYQDNYQGTVEDLPAGLLHRRVGNTK
jgi:hypothetical protein